MILSEAEVLRGGEYAKPEDLIDGDVIEQIKPSESEPVKGKEEVSKQVEPYKVYATDEDLNVTDPENIQTQASFVPFVEALAEHYGWDIKPEDVLEADNAEAFFNLIHEVIETNSTPQYASQDSAAFDDFLKKGGNPKDFFANYYGDPNDYNTVRIDQDDIDAQVDIYSDYLYEKGLSEKKIMSLVKGAEIDGTLYEDAMMALDYFKKTQNAQREQASKEVAFRAQQQAIENDNAVKATIATIANAGADQLGFEMNEKEKRNFIGWLFNVDQKTGKTGYDTFLEKTPNSRLKLAAMAFKGVLSEKDMEKVSKNKILDKVNKQMYQYNSNIAGGGRSTMVPVPNKPGKEDYTFFTMGSNNSLEL